MTNRSKEIRKEVVSLRNEGVQIFNDEIATKMPDLAKKQGIEKGENPVALSSAYQAWYSKSLRVVRALLPERLDEFIDCYEYNKGKKTFGFTDYKIRHYLVGAVFPGNNFEPISAFAAQIQHQISILDGVISIIGSKLSDILSELQYELFETELATASALLKVGQLRAAGAVSGVVLEQHLKTVCLSAGVSFKKKNLAIADFNEGLKSNGKIDTPMWRLIQRLADIRNICVHKRDDDPTASQLEDLIDGTKKVLGEVN